MVPHTQQAFATSLVLLLCLVVPIHADSEYPTSLFHPYIYVSLHL